MSVKEEHTRSTNNRTFEKTFNTYTQQNQGKWDLSNGLPDIGALRGQIKLIRRFASPAAKDINATAWADHTLANVDSQGHFLPKGTTAVPTFDKIVGSAFVGLTYNLVTSRK